ncbi:MAG: NAD(P)-dependent oxidoreductase [Gemmatimonadetes bacterium]|nr:NAD(P)-dependent oxidoreductase [Gemmatimonadota bacterium]
MPERKRVLVTGLSGVVGTAMRAELERRYEVSSLSRHGVEGFPDDRNFRGDIADLEAILPAFEGQHTVVHLAADRSFLARWESALHNNFIGTYNVFEAARRSGVKRVVAGSSTVAVGGYFFDEPYRYVLSGEFARVRRPYPLVPGDIVPRPLGYYGVSKAYGEALGSFYKDFHGLSAIHIRIGFTISTDDPTFSAAALATWLSHRDTAQVFVKAIDAPESLRYGVLTATSDNYWKVFSLDAARRLVGFAPQDGAGETFTPRPEPERDRTDYKQHVSDTVDETPDMDMARTLNEMFPGL